MNIKRLYGYLLAFVSIYSGYNERDYNRLTLNIIDMLDVYDQRFE